MSEETAASPQQSVVAAQGSTVQDVIQAMVTGTVTGDLHIGNIVYTRSAVEELRDYLERAVANYSLRMYGAVYEQAEVSHPYKFLDAFGIEDALIFCGRDTAIEALARKVGSHRLTVLHAKSGAGKTSLLQAGLSPYLFKQGQLPLYVRASENPIQAIKRAITASLHDPWPTLLADLALPIFLGMVCRSLKGKTKELVIMLDQFEEFFRFSLDAGQRSIYIRELTACYNDKTLSVRWLISLRKDYFSDLAEVERVSPSLQVFRNEYLLSAMTREEAKEAIIGPVAKLDASVRYAPDLLETLLADLERSAMELPLLQMLCTQLYEQRTSGQGSLTLEAYEALGQAEGVLRRYLVEAIAALPEREGKFAKTILKALVRSDGLKQRVSEKALAAHAGVDMEYLESILRHLVDARLVRPEEMEGERLYELAHEFLITEINTWIEAADLEFKQVEELLQREMINWRVHHLLLPKSRLEVLYTHKDQFTLLGSEIWAWLLRSAFVENFAVADWVKAASEDKDPALFMEITGLFIAPLKGEDENVRKRAVEALGKLKDARVVEPLTAALKDKHVDVRQQAVIALGRLKDMRAVEPLIAALRDKEDGVAMQATEALNSLNALRTIEPLTAALREGNQSVRRYAAETLGVLKDLRAVEPLIAALKDETPSVQEKAAEALGELKDMRAVEPLIAALRDGGSGMREKAAEALGKLNDSRAVEPLITVLHDNHGHHWSVRREAAEALGKLNDSRAVEPLIGVLYDNHEDWDVREKAAEALGKLNDPRAVEPLIVALHDNHEHHWSVRREAAEALKQIGTPEAIAALQDAQELLQRDV